MRETGTLEQGVDADAVARKYRGHVRDDAGTVLYDENARSGGRW